MHPNNSIDNFFGVTDAVYAEFWHRPVGPKGSRINFWLEWIRSGREVPPILVAQHEGEERYWRKGGVNWYVHDGTHRLSAMRMHSAVSGTVPFCWAEILEDPPAVWDDMRTWKRTGQYLRVY